MRASSFLPLALSVFLFFIFGQCITQESTICERRDQEMERTTLIEETHEYEPTAVRQKTPSPKNS
jgi:hypothetical protein